MDLMLSKTDLLLNQLLAKGHSGVGVGEGSQNKFLLELKNKICNGISTFPAQGRYIEKE